MPRRSITKEGDEQPIARRASARIAAVVKEPVTPNKKSSPKTPKRGASKKAVDEIVEVQNEEENNEQPTESLEDINGTETSSKEADDGSEPVLKKAKEDKAHDTKNTENVDEDKKDPDVESFEMINKSDVPKSDSEEVKQAVSAQGEDGSLLVGYVQIAKTEVLSHKSEEVQKVAESMDKGREAAALSKVDEKDKVHSTTINGSGSKTETVSNGLGNSVVSSNEPAVESTKHTTHAQSDKVNTSNENGTDSSTVPSQ